MSGFISSLSPYSPFSKKIERQEYPLNVTRRKGMIITNSIEKDPDGFENINDSFNKTQIPSDFPSTPNSRKPPLTPTPVMPKFEQNNNYQSSLVIEEEEEDKEEVNIENSPLETKKTFIEYSPIQKNSEEQLNTFDTNKILNPLKTPTRANSKSNFKRLSREEQARQSSIRMTPIVENAKAHNYHLPAFSPYVPQNSNQSSPLPSTANSPAKPTTNEHPKLTIQSNTPIKISRNSSPSRPVEQNSQYQFSNTSTTTSYQPSSRNDIVAQIESNLASYYYDSKRQDQNSNNNNHHFYSSQVKNNNTNFDSMLEVNRYMINSNNNQNPTDDNTFGNSRNKNTVNINRKKFRSTYRPIDQDSSSDNELDYPFGNQNPIKNSGNEFTDYSNNLDSQKKIFNLQNKINIRQNSEIENTSKTLNNLIKKKQESVFKENPSKFPFTHTSLNFTDDDYFSNYKPKPIQLNQENKNDEVNSQNTINNKYSNRKYLAKPRETNPFSFMNNQNNNYTMYSSDEDNSETQNQYNSTNPKILEDTKRVIDSNLNDDSFINSYDIKRFTPSALYDDQNKQNNNTQYKQKYNGQHKKKNDYSNDQNHYDQNEQKYDDQNEQGYDINNEHEFNDINKQNNDYQNENEQNDNEKIYYPNLEFNDKYLRRTSVKRLHRNEDNRRNMKRYQLSEEEDSEESQEISDNQNKYNDQNDNFFPQNKNGRSFLQNTESSPQNENFFPQNKKSSPKNIRKINSENSKFKKKSSSDTESDSFVFTPPLDSNEDNENQESFKNKDDENFGSYIENEAEEPQQTNQLSFDQDKDQLEPDQNPDPEQYYESSNESISFTDNIEPQNQDDKSKTLNMQYFSVEQVSEAPIFQPSLPQQESNSQLTYKVLDPSPPINQSDYNIFDQHSKQSPIKIPSIIALDNTPENPTRTAIKRIPRGPASVSNGIFNFDIDKTSTESDKTDNNKEVEDLSRKVGKDLIGKIKTPKSILKKRTENSNIENFNTPVKKLKFERPQNIESIKSLPISPAPNVNKLMTPLPKKVQTHEEESSDEILFQDSYITTNDEENAQEEFSSGFSPNPFSTPIRKKPTLAEMEQNSIRKVRHHHHHHLHQDERENEEEEENEDEQERLKQQQLEEEERLKQQQLEEEERLKQQQLEEEERLKQQQLEEEERLKQRQKEEDERLKQQQLEDEERLKQQQLEEEENLPQNKETENTEKSDAGTTKRRKKKHKSSKQTTQSSASISPKPQKLAAQTQTQTPQKDLPKSPQNDEANQDESHAQAAEDFHNETLPVLPDISDESSQAEEGKRSNTNSPPLSFEEMHNSNFPDFPSLPDSKNDSSSDEFEANNSGTVVNMASFRSQSPEPILENLDQASLPSPPSSPRGSESVNQQQIQLQSEEDGETGVQPNKDSISTKGKKTESKIKRTKKTSIIPPVANNYDPEFDDLPIALRRTKRPHTQPLRHWMNEKIIYKVADNGCLTQYAVQTDLQNSDIIDPLSPSTADVIDNIIIESQKLRKEKTQKKKSSPSNLDSEVIPKRIIPGIENPTSSVISFKGIEKKTLKSNEIEILPDKSLELDASKKKIMVVFSSGKAAQIEYRNGKKWKIKSGGQAYICKGDFATVRNMSNDESVHLFVIYN